MAETNRLEGIVKSLQENERYIRFLVFDEVERNARTEADSQLYLEDLLNMVKQLPNASGQVFRLYAIEGFSHKEISQQVGISEGTSKWHLSNARKKLQEMIRDEQNLDRKFETWKAI